MHAPFRGWFVKEVDKWLFVPLGEVALAVKHFSTCFLSFFPSFLPSFLSVFFFLSFLSFFFYFFISEMAPVASHRSFCSPFLFAEREGDDLFQHVLFLSWVRKWPQCLDGPLSSRFVRKKVTICFVPFLGSKVGTLINLGNPLFALRSLSVPSAVRFFFRGGGPKCECDPVYSSLAGSLGLSTFFPPVPFPNHSFLLFFLFSFFLFLKTFVVHVSRTYNLLAVLALSSLGWLGFE